MSNHEQSEREKSAMREIRSAMAVTEARLASEPDSVQEWEAVAGTLREAARNALMAMSACEKRSRMAP